MEWWEIALTGIGISMWVLLAFGLVLHLIQERDQERRTSGNKLTFLLYRRVLVRLDLWVYKDRE